jgi:hypothetical protein
VEAYRQIKSLITGPHEQIPEALVRRTIAEQYGIKPEEVTAKQIQFEVSGLLQTYPAITVVPSGKVLENCTSARNHHLNLPGSRA